MEALYLLLYKLFTIFSGIICIYFGYKLFDKGYFSEDSEFNGKIGDIQVVLKKAAPGTFFALFGMIIICYSVFTKFMIEKKTEASNEENNSFLDNSFIPIYSHYGYEPWFNNFEYKDNFNHPKLSVLKEKSNNNESISKNKDFFNEKNWSLDYKSGLDIFNKNFSTDYKSGFDIDKKNYLPSYKKPEGINIDYNFNNIFFKNNSNYKLNSSSKYLGNMLLDTILINPSLRLFYRNGNSSIIKQ